MNNNTRELQSYFCPFGFLDVQAACKIGEALSLSEADLFEIIDNDRGTFKDTGKCPYIKFVILGELVVIS